MDAAEQLLDEGGIDGTTGAKIITVAGNRNSAAVNYHFGNLDELIRAVLDRRAVELNARRHELFDALDDEGSTDPRVVFLAMTRPLTDLLERDEGRRYLRVLNQASNHPRFALVARRELMTSDERGGALLAPLVAHLGPRQQRHRSRNITAFVLHALAEQARAIDASEPDLLGPEEFRDDLADSSLAALAA